MTRTGKDLGYPKDHPFYDAEVISEYSVEQAVDDGLIIPLGRSGRLRSTTNFAFRVAGAHPSGRDATAESIDADLLDFAVSSIVSEYTAGAYCVPARASDYPEETDGYLACYLFDLTDRCIAPSERVESHQEIRVWAVAAGDGSLTIMLPEDY